MSPRGTVLSALACALSVAHAHAGPLEEALVKVYLASPRLAAARAGLRVADDEVPKALAGYRPDVAASSSVRLDLIDQGGSSDQLSTVGAGVALRQELYSGGRSAARTARAESAVRVERARLAALESAVLLETVAAFTGVARDQAVLELARANERHLERQLGATRDRQRLGDVTATDVRQAEARLANGSADRAAAEGALEVASAAYARLVGEGPGLLTMPEPPPGVPEALADAQAMADDNPRLLAARHEIEVAQGEVALATAERKPRLALSGSLGYAQNPSASLDHQHSTSIGAVLTVPLYQGGAEFAAQRQSRELVRQRQRLVDDLEASITAAVIEAWHDRRTAEARRRSLQQQIDATAFALDGVRQEALIGARTVLDVLDAEQEQFTAEVELVQVERDAVLAAYRLLAEGGRLSARDLALEVELFDPERYYRQTRGRWLGLDPEPEP